MTSSLCVPLPGEAGSERMTGCNPEESWTVACISPTPMAADAITNADIAELLAGESERTEGRAAKALRRASRAALMWPEEAGRLRDADRPFTELRAVGPFTARFISTWLREGTSVGERPPLRDGFLSYAQAREVVASHADWRTGLEGDLQMHTDETDGAASVEDMVAAARALGHHYVAITDHRTALEIDAYPDRQDLDVDRLRVVAESGGWVSIGTDAHTPSELAFFEIGIAAAIVAGLPRERILNYLPLRQLREWAGRIRARRHGDPAKRSVAMAGKRETIDTTPGKQGGSRYVRRDSGGRFSTDQVRAGRSVAQDRRVKAKNKAPKGMKDRGD